MYIVIIFVIFGLDNLNFKEDFLSGYSFDSFLFWNLDLSPINNILGKPSLLELKDGDFGDYLVDAASFSFNLKALSCLSLQDKARFFLRLYLMSNFDIESSSEMKSFSQDVPLSIFLKKNNIFATNFFLNIFLEWGFVWGA